MTSNLRAFLFLAHVCHVASLSLSRLAFSENALAFNETPDVLNVEESDMLQAMVVVRGAAAPRKPVIWVHISHNAGSLMCKWAYMNGERVVWPNFNCNSARFGDWYGFKKKEVTCAERVDVMQTQNATWSQIERTLDDGDICSGKFVYGVMLRDPIARLESEINFDHFTNYREFIKCVMEASIDKCPEPVPTMDSPHDHFMSYKYIDNLMIRALGGHAISELPPGGVNASHLDAALEFLNRADVIGIPLEYLTSDLAIATMDSALGWHIRDETKKVNNHVHEVRLSPEDIANLQYINRFDYELYNQITAPYIAAEQAA